MSNLSKIINILYQENGAVSSLFLAEKMNISTRSVQYLIKELRQSLNEEVACIEAVTGKGNGYKLIVKDGKEFKSFLKKIEESNDSLKETRIAKIIELLLSEKETTLNELLNSFYISESQLNIDFRYIKKVFAQYDLSLSLRKGQVLVEGHQFDIRNCILSQINIASNDSNKYYADYYKSLYDTKFKEELAGNMLSVFTKEKYRISDSDFQTILNYVLLVKDDDCNITFSKKDDPIENIDHLSTIAKEILSFINRDSSDEIQYLAIQLAGREIHEKQEGIVIPTSISTITAHILRDVSNLQYINLMNDFNLRFNISLYLMPLMVRIIYNLAPVSNSTSSNYVKVNFPYSYDLGLHTCYVLQKIWKKPICENDIAAFGLIFHEYMKHMHDPKKNNILMVCNGDSASINIIKNEVQEAFGSNINKLDWCIPSNIALMDLSEYSLVLAFTKIGCQIDLPVITIENMLDELNINDIKKAIDLKTKDVRQFIPEKLFFTDIKGETKEEILKTLFFRTQKILNLSDEFLTMMLERELLSSTDYVSGVATPHPYGKTTDYTFASVAILDKPVTWGRNKVQVVIMFSTQKGNTNETELFFKMISLFATYKGNISALLKNPSYDNFVKVMNGEYIK